MALEGQVRLLLRAWPTSDRVERGEEILTTTLDLVSPGRRRLPPALVASLVVGGLRARWRLRPSIWAWANYAFDQELPSRWHRWMLDDLLTRGWCRRMMARLLVCLGVIAWLLTVVVGLGDPAPALGDLLAVVMINAVGGSVIGAVLARSAWARERWMTVLAEHGYDQCGQTNPLLPTELHLKRARRGRRGADNIAALRWATALGREMLSAGKLEEAVALLSDTFERAKRIAPEREWPTWQAGYGLVCALAKQGRVDEAVPIAREVLGGCRTLHGPDHEGSLKAAASLGEFLRAAGRVEEATSLLSDAFQRAKTLLPADDWPTWWTGARLAVALGQQGRINEAVEISREVVAARCRLHGPDHGMTLEAAADLGELLGVAGRPDEALSLLRDTYERAKTAASEDAWPMWCSADRLARALSHQGRVDEAVQVAQEDLASRQRVLGSDHKWSLEAGTGLGELLRSAGRLEEAISVLRDTFERAASCAAAEAIQCSGKHLARAYADGNQLGEARDVAAAVLSQPTHTQVLRSDDVEFLQALRQAPGSSPS
ncbi:MAG TPA: tetratricopeptide repeat protein [Acidimicrobiales bacterium]|nr:tetratricopeptide repeat protein [Acidimicrobiales bacterium]